MSTDQQHIYEYNRKSVATWLTKDDFRKLCELARNNRVTVAAYLRAIIVDVLIEEFGESNSITLTNVHQTRVRVQLPEDLFGRE